MKSMKRRKLTQRQVAGMLRNFALRMSPHELRAYCDDADRMYLAQMTDPGKELNEKERDRVLPADECPAFDDMSGDE